MIVPKASSKLDYVTLKNPSPHIKRKFLKFAPIKVSRNILQMYSQNARKDHKGSANVTLGASVPLNLCMLMCKLLCRNCLSGLVFYELGMADRIISQSLSHCANVVTLGCDADRNTLLHYNSAHDKYVEDEA